MIIGDSLSNYREIQSLEVIQVKYISEQKTFKFILFHVIIEPNLVKHSLNYSEFLAQIQIVTKYEFQ